MTFFFSNKNPADQLMKRKSRISNLETSFLSTTLDFHTEQSYVIVDESKDYLVKGN